MSVEWLQHLPAPLRRSLYFGLQRAVGSRIGPVWRDYLAWARLGPGELEARLDETLGHVLAHALGHCAYYRGLGLARRPGQPAADFLREFPILTRQIIRARFADLVDDRLRGEITSPDSRSPRRYGWTMVKTGGTTGHPTTVVHDAQGRDWGRATRLFTARLCGLRLGTPYFRLWGSEADLLKTRAGLAQRVQQALQGAILMNAFRSQAPDLRRHYETLRRHPDIQCLETYVDAAVILADYIRDQNLPAPRLKSIIATAGTVTPEWRRILETTFGARVFDKYGSRECCDLACECEAHAGLHVQAPNAFLEVVDAAGAPCPSGQTGRILVTLLHNPSFPLIRYEIGDLAQWAPPGPCACGLAWPRLQSLQGRADDVLVTQDGTPITSLFVRHFLGVSLNRQTIRQWQLEQTGPDRFVFRHVAQPGPDLDRNLADITAAFREALGRGVSIEMVRVPEIPLSATGKTRWIINSWRGRDTAGPNLGTGAPPRAAVGI